MSSFPTRGSASYRESNFTVIVLKPRRRLVPGLLALFRRQSGALRFEAENVSPPPPLVSLRYSPRTAAAELARQHLPISRQ
jgi:hypothetical protein